MRRLISAFVAGVLLPAAATAQPPAESFATLGERVKRGDRVLVTDRQGREVSGRIVDLSSSSISLRADLGERRLPAGDVMLIRQPRADSVLDGTLKGLAIGGGLGLIMETTCSSGSYCAEAPDGQMLLAGVVWGTGIGLLVDAIRKTPHEIYRAAPPLRVQAGAMAGRGRAGAILTMRW